MKKHMRACISAVLVVFLIISGIFGQNTYVRAVDAQYIEQLRAAGFPESYIISLAQLHEKYPMWQFTAVHTGLEWNTVIEMESRNGWNLVPKSSDDAKKSIAAGAYDWYKNSWTIYDGSAWVGAHPDYIAYCMDPRNYLDEESIFQFESLSYSDNQTKAGVEAILKGTFMETGMIEVESSEEPTPQEPETQESESQEPETQESESQEPESENGAETETETEDMAGFAQYGSKKTTQISYAEAFVRIGKATGVSPYHLASRVRQEQGMAGTSSLISGTYKGYEGYYNYFNVGAAGTTTALVIQNGLSYAKKAGWNTRYKALLGGAQLIAKNYIGVGQDTLYFQKFNVVNANTLYSHQYMGNVTAALTEGKKLGEGYSDKQQAFVFRIPLYNNMPEQAVEFNATGNPNNYLKSLLVKAEPQTEEFDGELTPSFDGAVEKYSLFVESGVESILVEASAVAATSTVSGTGVVSLEAGINMIDVQCISGSGSVKTYTLTVVRQEPDESVIPTLSSEQLHIGDEYITGVTPGMEAAAFLECFSVEDGTLKLLGADGKEVSGMLATGQRLQLYDSSEALIASYEIVVYGDVNGDGAINVLDMIKVNRYILALSDLSGCYLSAADANRAEDGVNVLDMIHINRHALGLAEIKQE